MAYTARTLTTRSWYLSGIVGRRAQTVDGDQIKDGLMLLNDLLAWKSIDIALIPYWKYDTSITTVPGQESYFIPNCLAIESITFNLDSVRYSMNFATRRAYFGSSRADNITSLPFNWNFNRELGGGRLYLYFIPDSNFPLKFMGKFGFTSVDEDTDLTLVYDLSYIAYLRYVLAQYMCSEYGILFNPESEKILNKMTRQLLYVSPPDLSVNKASILNKGADINWGDVNIGMGFRPI